MTSRQTHVVFGTGPLGRATATALLSAGYHVIIASRSGTMTEPPSGAELVALDLGNVTATTAACRGAAAIYFCAAPAYHRWETEFPSLLEGAIAVAEMTGARLVVADNLYAYGQVDGPMTETLALRPDTRKGRVRAKMYARLVAAGGDGGLEFVAARGSDFYGPWVEGSAVGSRLIRAIAAGKGAAFLGATDNPHSFTYIGDFGRTLAILGTAEGAVGQAWHVPNAPPVTPDRFVEIAARIAETRTKLRAASWMEQRLIGMFIPAVREGLEMRYQFDRPFIVDHSKFATAFGAISTTLETGLQATLAWERERRNPPGRRP